MPKASDKEATVDVRAQIGVWSFTIRYVMQELFSRQCRVRCLTLREA